jgi:transcriptional regulator PpsR
MHAPSSPRLSKDSKFPRGVLGDLKASVAATLAAAGGDVAMVIDRDGVICDMAVSNDDMARDGAESWLDRRWSDTVAADSRHKVDELLRDALKEGRSGWREVNQVTPSQESLMVRYVTVDAGREGHVIAIGRDDRATAMIQQRLLEAQQAMERDYSRLRDAEFRYRLLFQTSGEAVVVVDASTRRVVDANPAAELLVSARRASLTGELFTRLFSVESQDNASSVLTLAQTSARGNNGPTRLWANGREFLVSASMFRQDRTSQYLVRIWPTEQAVVVAQAPEFDPLDAVLERIPDAFVLTDGLAKILAANTAFLDLVRVGSKDQVIDQPLSRYLGRAGLDRNLLIDNLRAHGAVRNFSTVLRNQFDEQEDVEISGVSAPDGAQLCYGFTIRGAGRRVSDRSSNSPELRRSVEQLTTLVGRVTLKELVRETTDLVERLCIEAALELTNDNRASAAEVLGLSRQSLYSKLHRFGLGNLSEVEN